MLYQPPVGVQVGHTALIGLRCKRHKEFPAGHSRHLLSYLDIRE